MTKLEKAKILDRSEIEHKILSSGEMLAKHPVTNEWQYASDFIKNTHGGSRPNSGRPSKEPTGTINFRIPISDKEKLKKLPISKIFKEWYKGLI